MLHKHDVNGDFDRLGYETPNSLKIFDVENMKKYAPGEAAMEKR